eukprot:9501818-Pyramimonas_sp.AAC.1
MEKGSPRRPKERLKLPVAPENWTCLTSIRIGINIQSRNQIMMMTTMTMMTIACRRTGRA